MTVDLLTIGLLVVLEALLSADNALVMAVIVMRLPPALHVRALSYGLVGAFALRIAATLVATYLIRLAWVKLVGGLYLFYLVYQHFAHGEDEAGEPGPQASDDRVFWLTIVRLELINLAFSIDSILVAVAVSPKRWVVMMGGLLGVLAMRLVVSQLIALMRRWPALVDGAFVIIAWVAVRLVVAYVHDEGWIAWEISQAWALSVILVLLVISIVWAISRTPVPSGQNGK